MSQKNILFCGDFHCGHLVGLTPPEWQIKTIVRTTSKRNKFYKIARELWTLFDADLKKLPPLDCVVFNGDLIEGKGPRSGGTELLTSVMRDQCGMAVSVIDHIRHHCRKGYKLIGTYGTDYHTATNGDDWENIIKDKAQFDKVGAHEWLDVNGLVFDIKHHIGGSQIPHGRHTASAREALWNDLWSLAQMQPRADVIIRSHVHYYQYCGSGPRLCMTLPAMQGMGSKHGARRCCGLVDFGFVLFEVEDKTHYRWTPFLHAVQSQKVKMVKL